MISLEIKSTHYNYLVKSYKEYLQVLGYVENPRKLTPVGQNKLTPLRHFKLTP